MADQPHKRLHRVRRGCEHFALGGAVMDVVSLLFHVKDFFILALFCKGAILAGIIGIYLVHQEERYVEEKLREEARAVAMEIVGKREAA